MGHMRWGERARINSRNESVRAADKGWFQHGFEDSVTSGTEKRLHVIKVLNWCSCTRKEQLSSTTYAHAKGSKESGWLRQD